MVDNLALLVSHIMLVVILYRCFMYADDNSPVAGEPGDSDDERRPKRRTGGRTLRR